MKYSEQGIISRSSSNIKYRYPIRDRCGRLLALSKSTVSVYVDPFKVTDISLIDELVSGSRNKILQAKAKNLRFLWLIRHADPDLVTNLKSIKGVYCKNDYKRVYVERKKFSNVLGFCDASLNGKSGVELVQNSQLFQKDVTINLDKALQMKLYDILEQGYSDFQADGASGVIIEIPAGNILSMVSIPSPEVPIDFLDHAKRNRNLDPVEVGSVLKLLNLAIALESGKYTPDSIVDARGPLIIDKYEITDLFGVNKQITLKESIWHSSNIANARVGLSLTEYQKHMMQKLGLFNNVNWMHQSNAWPICPKFSRSTTATMSYGYGIGLTTLHLAQVMLAIFTGYKINPTLTQVYNCKERIFSRETVRQVLSIAEEVVARNRHLRSKKVSFGAKTGTANMIVDKKYAEGVNFVTLVSVVPSKNPKLLIIMQMANPKAEHLKYGQHTTAGNVLSVYMKQLVEEIQLYLDLSQ